MREYLSLLKKAQLFENIDAGDLATMLDCIRPTVKEFRKSEFIFLEGEKLEQFGVLLQGTIYMIKEDVWGNKTILDFIYSGDLFGESVVCGGSDSNVVSYQAMTNCRAMFFPFHKVLHCCRNSCAFHNRLIENMVKIIAQKNILMLSKMEIISKKTIRERLLTWISQQVQLHKSNCFPSPMGRVELAEYLCVDRSALTRELGRMKNSGLIDYDRLTYCLKKLKP